MQGRPLRLNFLPATMTIVLLVVCHVFAAAAAGAQENSAARTSRPLFGFAIRNALLEERFHRTRNEQEAVSKLLMNTNVTGSQSTVTETRLRIVPDDKSLRFELLNSGDVTSQTTGFNQQARSTAWASIILRSRNHSGLMAKRF